MGQPDAVRHLRDVSLSRASIGYLKAAAASTTASLKGALAAVLLIAPVTAAQRVETSVDLGGAALRYADTLSTRTATVTPRLTANWSADLLETSASYSQFTSGGWSVQGLLSESHFIPTDHGLLGEVGAFAGGSRGRYLPQ